MHSDQHDGFLTVRMSRSNPGGVELRFSILSICARGLLKHDDNFQEQLFVYFPGDKLKDKFLVSAGTGKGECGVVDIVQQGGGWFALLHEE